MPNTVDHALMCEFKEISQHMVGTWGSGAIGSVLICRSLSGEPWITARELSAETHLSTSQARRRLLELKEQGKVMRRKDRERVRYTASPEWAGATVAFIREKLVHFAPPISIHQTEA